MSVDINKFKATLGAISSDVQESVNNVRNAEKANEPRRQLIVNGVVAVLVVLTLIVGYNRLFVSSTTTTVETPNVAPENEVIQAITEAGQRLTYKIDLIDKKFTVLHIDESTGNSLVVDTEGDVWAIAGEFKPENAEPTDLRCDSYAITLALTMPQSVLQNCVSKTYHNNTQFKTDVPVCDNGQKLHVIQTSNSFVGYECR